MSQDPAEPSSAFSPPHAPTPEFQRDFQRAIEDWAAATKGKDPEAAQAAAIQALALAAEEAERNRSPTILLQQKADELESQGKWPEAEGTRRQVLSLAESEGNPGISAKAQLDLAQHLRMRGRMQEALDGVAAAVDLARSSGISTLLAMMLDARGGLLLEANRAAEALGSFDEAMSATDPELGVSMRARIHAARARCYVMLGEEAKAEEDLKACREYLDGIVIGVFPGPISLKCRWLEASAALAASRRDFAKAIEAIEQALRWWQQLEGATAQVARARLLSKMADYCNQAGDERRARSARDEQATLWSRLGLESV